MPNYSYGLESPIKFEISDKLANHYNEAVEQFLKAQQRFNQKFGRQWNPATEPIKIKWSTHQRKAWNKMSKIINNYIAQNGPILAGDVWDDFLVKDTALQVAQSAIGNKSRMITTAAALGALYVLLRGL